MKAIILYYSKHGGCESLAMRIQMQLKCDIAPVSTDIKLEAYDTIIIGTSMYASMFNKKVKEFVSTYGEELKQKRVFMFTSGISLEPSDQIIRDNLGENFYALLTYRDSLGGILDFARLSYFERQILKMVNKKMKFLKEIKKDTTFTNVDEARVQTFIQTIQTYE